MVCQSAQLQALPPQEKQRYAAAIQRFKNTIDKYIEANGVEARYQPAGITSIMWGMGYGTDYRWIDIPLFDGKGYPSHQRGVTTVPGVYIPRLPWQNTWGSGRFSGVAEDARFLADAIKARHAVSPPPSQSTLNELALGS